MQLPTINNNGTAPSDLHEQHLETMKHVSRRRGNTSQRREHGTLDHVLDQTRPLSDPLCS